MIWCYIKPLLEVLGPLVLIIGATTTLVSAAVWMFFSRGDIQEMDWRARLWLRFSAASTVAGGIYLLWPFYIARVHELCGK